MNAIERLEVESKRLRVMEAINDVRAALEAFDAIDDDLDDAFDALDRLEELVT